MLYLENLGGYQLRKHPVDYSTNYFFLVWLLIVNSTSDQHFMSQVREEMSSLTSKLFPLSCDLVPTSTSRIWSRFLIVPDRVQFLITSDTVQFLTVPASVLFLSVRASALSSHLLDHDPAGPGLDLGVPGGKAQSVAARTAVMLIHQTSPVPRE